MYEFDLKLGHNCPSLRPGGGGVVWRYAHFIDSFLTDRTERHRTPTSRRTFQKRLATQCAQSQRDATPTSLLTAAILAGRVSTFLDPHCASDAIVSNPTYIDFSVAKSIPSAVSNLSPSCKSSSV
jgi:hypothetical protein